MSKKSPRENKPQLSAHRENARLRGIRVPKEVVVPWYEDLDDVHLRLLAICLWCIRYGNKAASRRNVVEIAADVLRDYQGTLLNPDGTAFEIVDIDEELGGPHFDWLRDLFALALGDVWSPNKKTEHRLRVVLAVIIAGGPALWRGLLTPYKIDD